MRFLALAITSLMSSMISRLSEDRSSDGLFKALDPRRLLSATSICLFFKEPVSCGSYTYKRVDEWSPRTVGSFPLAKATEELVLRLHMKSRMSNLPE